MALTPKENLLRTIRHEDPEWVPNGLESVLSILSPVVERSPGPGYDAFGVHWSLDDTARGGTYPARGGHTIHDLSRWREQITVPDVDHIDWCGVQARVQEIDRDECLVAGFVETGLFERSCLLLGMKEALMAYVTEPESMEELLAAIADYKVRLIDRFDEVADLDMMWYGDDWGTQEGLFMRPDVWRRVVKPHTRRIYDCMKERGILIDQHSCGKIEAVFGDIVDMGADIFDPCQPCNDLAALKRQYAGQICFYGGIDSQFVLDRPGATPEEVRAEVRRRIDEMAYGGGYIAGPSQSLPYDEGLLDAMNDEIDRHGRLYYGRAT